MDVGFTSGKGRECTAQPVSGTDRRGAKVVHTLEKQGNLQINTLVVETDIPVHKMSAILFELEMKGAVRVLAGGVYQLL